MKSCEFSKRVLAHQSSKALRSVSRDMPSQNPEATATAARPDEPGFRLERLELWNWGTFHGQAQTLDTCGGWSLLVGDNGSGKSTAIDALRTLLVPPRMLNY